MIPATIPTDEQERLADLHALRILDTRPERRFDRIVSLAKRIFDVPIAYIALVDSDRQWLKSRCGLSVDETGRDISFCGHAIAYDGPMIVPDAREDDRFHDNPLVVGEPYVRFYAGHPLEGPNGYHVGTLCICDTQPRKMSSQELATFSELAELATHELQMVDLIEAQHSLLETQRKLSEAQARLTAEIAEAADYVQSLLPPRLESPIRTDWKFIASSQLGGDIFGYHELAGGKWAFYLLDACGHGVGASLLSVSVYTALRRETLPDTNFEDPAEVLSALNRAFPMSEHQGKFLTAWYGVYDPATRELTYASAGHHAALLFSPESTRPSRLGHPSLMIGPVPEATYDNRRVEVPAGGRLYAFSDGAFELRNPTTREMLGYNRLAELLDSEQNSSRGRLDTVETRIREFAESEVFADDFSLLEIEFS